MAASHHVEDARGRAARHLPISHADDEAERTVERRQVTQRGESVALAAWRERGGRQPAILVEALREAEAVPRAGHPVSEEREDEADPYAAHGVVAEHLVSNAAEQGEHLRRAQQPVEAHRAAQLEVGEGRVERHDREQVAAEGRVGEVAQVGHISPPDRRTREHLVGKAAVEVAVVEIHQHVEVKDHVCAQQRPPHRRLDDGRQEGNLVRHGKGAARDGQEHQQRPCLGES
eukprot:scaffold132538_cov69-Phaeocystis_antarctica.AAC.5